MISSNISRVDFDSSLFDLAVLHRSAALQVKSLIMCMCEAHHIGVAESNAVVDKSKNSGQEFQDVRQLLVPVVLDTPECFM